MTRHDDDSTESHPLSTHLDNRGQARMVDVGEKSVTARRAVASARVTMAPSTLAALREQRTPKGDVLATARIAGIQAAKRTPELIPLCHAIALTKVKVDFALDDHGVSIEAVAEARDRTGVEMEALTAATVSALTLYDMLKGVDRAMTITDVRLEEKAGGKTGHWLRPEPAVTSAPAAPTAHADPKKTTAEPVPVDPAHFVLTSEPIDADVIRQRVAHPRAGAVCMFYGTVRDRNDGLAVTKLEYEAYDRMVCAEMRRCAEEIQREFPGVRLAATHRVGTLAVGDDAILCAASAPHRAEAFEAARRLIDEIKARAPIWKREHGPDGPYWVRWEDARVPR
jgi:cyclic pyranopterin phosphate synthase